MEYKKFDHRKFRFLWKAFETYFCIYLLTFKFNVVDF